MLHTCLFGLSIIYRKDSHINEKFELACLTSRFLVSLMRICGEISLYIFTSKLLLVNVTSVS